MKARKNSDPSNDAEICVSSPTVFLQEVEPRSVPLILEETALKGVERFIVDHEFEKCPVLLEHLPGISPLFLRKYGLIPIHPVLPVGLQESAGLLLRESIFRTDILGIHLPDEIIEQHKHDELEAEAVVRHNKERDQGMGFLLPAFILRVVSEDIDFCIQIELPIRIDLLQVPRILTQFAVLPVVGGAGENSVLKVFLQVVVCLCRRPAVQSLV